MSPASTALPLLAKARNTTTRFFLGQLVAFTGGNRFPSSAAEEALMYQVVEQGGNEDALPAVRTVPTWALRAWQAPGTPISWPGQLAG